MKWTRLYRSHYLMIINAQLVLLEAQFGIYQSQVNMSICYFDEMLFSLTRRRGMQKGNQGNEGYPHGP